MQAAVEVRQRQAVSVRGRHRQHRLELLWGDPALGVVAAQAVVDEATQFGDVGARGLLADLHLAHPFRGGGQQSVERQVDPALDQGARQAQCIAAQRERILVAGRPQPGGEATGQGVQALGNRQHPAQRGRGDGIGGKTRHPRLVQRRGQRLRLAGGGRVVAPGDALQLRELADHA